MATCFLDDGYGITAASELDVHRQVQALVPAAAFQEPHESPFTLSLHPDEDDSPGLHRTVTPHPPSTDLGDAAEHAGAVLGIETSVAPKAANVLGTVHPGCSVPGLLNDEDLFLLQVVE